LFSAAKVPIIKKNTKFQESTEWRVQSGEYRVESKEWRVQSGEYRVESTEVRGER